MHRIMRDTRLHPAHSDYNRAFSGRCRTIIDAHGPSVDVFMSTVFYRFRKITATEFPCYVQDVYAVYIVETRSKRQRTITAK